MTNKLIQQFRDAVYQSLLKRPDAVLDLIDALTVAGHVESPVTLSEQTPFRRKFSMVYDTLSHAVIDLDALLHTLLDYQPAESETMGGYEVYGLDATKDERPEAETLPERCSLKSQKDEPVVYGHKYSWLVRLVGWGTSWVAPQDTLRIDPELSDSQVGSQQVKELAGRNPKPKVVVADSLYGNHIFLAIFLRIQNTFALVRMRSNNVLYEQPEPRPPGKKGAPKKHGARFKLSGPARPADTAETFLLGSQTVHIQAWNGLHLKKLPKLIVMLLRVEFLKPDGKPRYKQPMWLLWTGSTAVSLQALCRMYLWRFAIEIVFTQMTKTDVFAGRGGRNNISDLNISILDHYPINQQLDQFPSLIKVGILQARLNALAKQPDRVRQPSQFLLPVDLAGQLVLLFFQPLLVAFQFTSPTLIFR